MTKQFGWLQASATNVSSLSITPENPATIRICIAGILEKVASKDSAYVSRWDWHVDCFGVATNFDAERRDNFLQAGFWIDMVSE
jgi:hypothetical protein